MERTDLDRKDRQVRSAPTTFSARSDGDEGPVIEGYFAVFNSDYEIWPGASEQVAPDAFNNCLDLDVRALCDHMTNLVLGRTSAGTLELRVDEKGLWGKIKINEQDSDAMNLYARVQRGDVSQCSFGFDILDEEYVDNRDGSCTWILHDVYLWEVSVVTFPAYAETSVEARKKDRETELKRQLELRKKQLKERIASWH
jgi:hypothetical protein